MIHPLLVIQRWHVPWTSFEDYMALQFTNKEVTSEDKGKEWYTTIQRGTMAYFWLHSQLTLSGFESWLCLDPPWSNYPNYLNSYKLPKCMFLFLHDSSIIYTYYIVSNTLKGLQYKWSTKNYPCAWCILTYNRSL